ncbi:HD domain-containing protein [Methanospirillum lacunae]|uniref:HD family phosphohydrolase n=1 Tax=Methanospirillum lacunae TaxID=668570 RepID=A0A2V2MUY5_9EURY|nr:HD domain-containing protein [Methanospirillum lacunae]PWR71984.1 HD family phosphohydrolase [Methanospirillum lacunae]
MITSIMADMVRYFDGDVRRINHALKVHSFAQIIASESEIEDSKKILINIAAILHDIGIKEAERKYNSSSGKHQEIEGPPIARQILSPYHLDPDHIERICFLIGNHHTYRAIDDIDFQILVEADFLVNFFEDSMSNESVWKIKENYFKTQSGTRLLTEMYL